MRGRVWWRIAVGLASLGPVGAKAADHLPRIVHADIVALDQLLVYNRFGSFDPYGMIFALRRDVSALDGAAGKTEPDETGSHCDAKDGTEPGTGPLEPGEVRLKDCKRPRPLVLRGTVGDILEVRVTNLLRGKQPDISETWCEEKQRGTGTPPTRADARAAFEKQCHDAGQIEKQATGEEKAALAAERHGDWPRTRRLSFVLPGLEPVAGPDPKVAPECMGLAAVEPGRSFTCRFRLEREGTHLFSSLAAPAGGEGDGGSLTQGLFGALIVEAAGAETFRSQVSEKAFGTVWKPREGKPDKIPHARQGDPDYRATRGNAEDDPLRGPQSDPTPAYACGGKNPTVPVLRLMRDCDGTVPIQGVAYRRAEIVHADLNAIVVPGPRPASPGPRDDAGPYAKTGEDLRTEQRLEREAALPFREFTVIFHDELKTFYADNFKELDEFGQLSGVRDGFAINYGASGLGAMMVAQRKGIGPAANCPECLYEEFFLESWANGDPALLERYVDDPSNVHHSYLNDKVVFRNLHAGKETHVFHLHTHQWFAGNDENRGAYLDSQTIGPQQGFTYRIYHGGLDRHDPRGEAGYGPQTPAAQGYFEAAKGSGNRNRTVGDAIFHCHLYPHFAQGMWALWRVHDVLEDGSRKLPDGQRSIALSTEAIKSAQTGVRRGSVDPLDGSWLTENQGTPIPGLIPVPGEAAPPIPTYTARAQEAGAGKEESKQAAKDTDDSTARFNATGMPGYPFYVAGVPGHRAPQAPLDMAWQADGTAAGGRLLDGGLPRHVVIDGRAVPSVATKSERDALLKTEPEGQPQLGGTLIARGLALGDVTTEFEHLKLRLLPHEGTALERNAMAFHHDGVRRSGADGATEAALDVKRPDGEPAGLQEGGGYPTQRLPMPGGPAPDTPAFFHVNGAPPAPGAPFADPCGAPSGMDKGEFRRFVGHRAAADAQNGEPARLEAHDAYERGVFTPVVDALLAGDRAIAPIRGREPVFVPDPGLLGLRRYEVSAVQFDMTVNRAGWHDPQARIAVLTRKAADWKSQRSARAEPFFFRAFSGECIELRHTNETPKDLELDDFQLKVPTDTIGQHIHLVKFDVTSSDGSGNGFNYEDATFAPDEILSRICAARKRQDGIVGTPGAAVADRSAECAAIEAAKTSYRDALGTKDPEKIREAIARLKAAQVWHRTDAPSRKYFQTTVQRWFADPILSNTGDSKATDRTLRTVFTHDHFTPSNIQQHGYYAALLIEPNTHRVERFRGPEDGPSTAEMAAVTPPEPLMNPLKKAEADTLPVNHPARVRHVPKLAQGDPNLVGARANVTAMWPALRAGESSRYEYGDPIHPDTREYALAIADMALLYDGKGQTRPEFEAEGRSPRDPKGLTRLVAEARCRIQAVTEEDAARDADLEEGERVPARAGGLCVDKTGKPPKDAPPSAFADGESNRTHAGAVLALATHAEDWRAGHGRPVEPPPRPEAITQKHHNPYLVSYRGEPVPLRIGSSTQGGGPLAFVTNPCSVPRSVWASPALPTPDDEDRREGVENHRHIRGHRSGEAGDLSNVFRSAWTHKKAIYGHGDPCTPLLEGYGNERLLVRLIQGAQEVQHLFRIEGAPFRRNVDQHFPTARPLLSHANGLLRSRFDRCQDNRDAKDGRPRDFRDWLIGKSRSAPFWDAFEELAGGCDNLMAVVAAKEIGISEHFEIGGYYRAESPSNFSAMMIAKHLGSPIEQPDDATDAKGGSRTLTLRRNNSGINPALHPEVVGTSNNRQALDYQYGFGSADAMWNGAFGLLRIYDSPNSSDLGRCLRDPAKAGSCLGVPSERIGDRLAVLRTPQESRARSSALPSAPVEASQASAAAPVGAAPTLAAEQTLACPSASPQVTAVMVAVRAGEVHAESWGTLPGMPYDREKQLYDPDALLIVGISLADAVPGIAVSTVHDVLKAGILRRGELIKKVKETLKGTDHPHPYVLRVLAGDCMTVLMVNALAPKRGDGDEVRDIPGDALLPNIVPLNTDPLQAGGASGRELRSSSRVVFTLPGSLTSPRSGVAFPFGINAVPALVSEEEAGGPETREGRKVLPVASSRATTFYAGNLFVRGTKLVEALVDPSDPWEFDLSLGRRFVARERDARGCRPPDVESAVLGVLFCIGWKDGTMEPVPLDFTTGSSDEEKSDNARVVAQSLVDFLKKSDREASFLKAVPYAFGALPIRVAGDTFGHGSHGMMGTLIVEPVRLPRPNDEATQDAGAQAKPRKQRTLASIPDRIAIEKDGERLDNQFESVAKPWSDEGVLIVQPDLDPCRPNATCEAIPSATVREHTLLWQDGLNLWSRAWSRGRSSASLDPVDWGYDTRIDEAWDPDLPARERGYPGHPMPNCTVCDDSYDLGEKGVSYRSAPFARRLAGWSHQGWTNPLWLGLTHYPNDRTNLNAYEFPPKFFDGKEKMLPTPRLLALPGEQVAIRVAHPAGRARQRSFSLLGHAYDDLLPGFGSGHAGLLGPGKALTASVCASREPGSYLYRDGPQPIFASGVFGLLDVLGSADPDRKKVGQASACTPQ